MVKIQLGYILEQIYTRNRLGYTSKVTQTEEGNR